MDHPMDNPTQIAKVLGMSRTTVYKYLTLFPKYIKD